MGLHRRTVPPAGRRHDPQRLAADSLPAARLSRPSPAGSRPDAPPRIVHAERRHRDARAAARRRQRARHDAPLARAQREDRPRPGRLGVSVRPDHERQARRSSQRRPRVHRARRWEPQRHRGGGARREAGEGRPALPDRRPDSARGVRVSDQKVCPTCGPGYPHSERFCPRDGTALRSSSATGDLIGSIVAERYHILKKLGEGGMGTVYLAEHVKMARKAALKVMNPGMNSDPDAIARFNREAANASRLNHANVCAIYDFGETPEGLIYLAMEFIEGESLTSIIEKNGFLPAPRAAAIIHQAADALAVAHDYGIVHRDLKPDNIMIAKDRDGSDVVKVVDFGIAKASSSDAQKVTKTGLVVGTPEYMSPEQLAGDKLDGRSDIYSLGLVAFNCLTGLLPFPSNSAQEAMIMRLTDLPKTLAEMRPDIDWPPELQAVMDKVLARDVNERYQKSAEFGRDIAKAVENMPAAVAATAGTMVMGASPAAEVPKTRMAPKSGATAKIEAAVAPAAAAKKSPVMMIVAAAVVVVAIGGGVVFMKSGGG